MVWRALLIVAFACQPAVLAADVVVTTERFELRSEPRVNLHHFLIAWAAAERNVWPPFAPVVAERGAWRAQLSASEQRRWASATRAYEATVGRNPIFDEGLIALRDWAAGAGSEGAVPSSDRSLVRALELALPIYERHWWRAHDAQNRAWIEAVAALLASVEDDLAQRVEWAYGGRWPPAPIAADVVLYPHALGAYSTGGRITIGSLDSGHRMPQALEMLFHEASHVPSLESPLRAGIDAAFQQAERQASQGFWHDMIFFSAGALTRIVLEAHGQPGYRHYGELGVYRRGEQWAVQLPLLEEHWLPFLASRSSDAEARARALAAIAERLPRP
jgi:hypothetical protein